jgi:redox-sensitive bicupin YhaK (pirin superfamily)
MRKVSRHVELSSSSPSAGFSAIGLRAHQIDLDPFLNVDLFHMSQPTFPPHPHAGFSAVTYMLPESRGSFTNRDSLGDQSIIGPGAVHWTQAARGMMHEEIPSSPGTDCWGFQIFVNLSVEHQMLPPRAFHADRNEIPVVQQGGARVAVVAGRVGEQSSPLHSLATPVSLFDLDLQANARLELPIPRLQNAWLFAIAGSATVSDGTAVVERQALGFEQDGDTIELLAGPAGFRALVGAGHPLRQAVSWSGPFAMATREAVLDAHRRFANGEMGSLRRSF